MAVAQAARVPSSLRGSPINFGTDYSGSIRLPAAFNGLYDLNKARPIRGMGKIQSCPLYSPCLTARATSD